MKRTLLVTILLALICFASTASAYELYENTSQIILNDQPVSFNVPPLTLNERTLVPMRKIFELLGADVQWKAETRSVVAQKGDDIIILSIDSNTAIVNSEPVLLDAPAILYESNTMVPLRFVSEQFHLSVEFDAAAKKIIIKDIYNPYDIEELKKQDNYQEIDYDGFIYYGGTKNNKPHGLGTVIDENGVTLFEGSFVDDTWCGYGKLYYPNGTLQYAGYFENDNYHGYGVLYDENGIIASEGYFENGHLNGYGKFYYEDGTLGYVGMCKNDLPFGEGTHYYANGNKMFEGNYNENALLEGSGIEYYENGYKAYEGDFRNGIYHGVGTVYTEEGRRIGTYEFNNGEQGERLIAFALEEDGKTAKQYPIGDFIYVGEVDENEIPNGIGLLYYKSMDVLYYYGDFVNGRMEGYGKEYGKSGSLLYEGEFQNNKQHGYGIVYATDGTVLYTGNFANGSVVDDNYNNNNYSYTPSISGGYSNYNYNSTPSIKTAKKLYLFANDGTGTFLGNLNLNKYDTDSIANTYGDYGSKYSQTSIFNTYGTYGSKYGQYSAFNEYATNPPKIVDENGNLIGYLTANKYLANAISYEELIIYLNR